MTALITTWLMSAAAANKTKTEQTGSKRSASVIGASGVALSTDESRPTPTLLKAEIAPSKPLAIGGAPRSHSG